MKIFYRFFLLFFIISVPVFSASKGATESTFPEGSGELKILGGGESLSSGRSPSYLSKSVNPGLARPLSASEAILMDLSVPGGGHFYIGNYWEGSFWLAAKSLTAFGIYFTHQRYSKVKESQNRANPDPAAVNNQERKTLRSAMNLWFAIFGEFALYSISLYRVMERVSLYNQRFLPHFELTWQKDFSEYGNYQRLCLSPLLQFSWQANF